jgi:hypothetical protein
LVVRASYARPILKQLFALPGSAPIALSEQQQFSAAHPPTKLAQREVCRLTSRYPAGLSPSEHVVQQPCAAEPRLKQPVPPVRKYELASDFHQGPGVPQLPNPTAPTAAVRGLVRHEAAVIRVPDLP